MADRRNSEREHLWVEERLSDYIDNQLAPLERAQLERHVRDCARCQRSLAALRWTVSLVKQAPAPALPRQFTLPIPQQKVRPRSLPAFGFGFARLATVVATLLLFAVVGIDVISQLGGTLTGSAPAPAAMQNVAQPTSIALAPGQAEDQSKQPTPTTAASEKLFAAPTAAPLPAAPPTPTSAPISSPTVIFGRGGGLPETSSTETAKSLAATAAPPRAPALRASGTPTTGPLTSAASLPPTVAPTITPQPTATLPLPTATATVPPPTETAQPSSTPEAQALVQPTVAPFAQSQVETAEPVVTPIRATEIGLFFFAVFFAAVTVLLWRRR
jgi:hypothetical protein